MAEFDWKNPDYTAVFQQRIARLNWIRGHDVEEAQRAQVAAKRLANLKRYYRDHPADFINDWGMTFDPRNGDVGWPTSIPFILFPKQRDFVAWVMDMWQSRRKALADKSRDMGFSWLLVCTAATICLFRPGITIGFGSRDEDSVDKIGDPDSLFWKLRFFIEHLPPEFRGDWSAKRHTAHMRVSFPGTGSVINGDAGDNIGRGGRASIYIVDEAAALKNPAAIEASLSQTTNCRIDVSTPRGMANPFAQKRHSGKFPVFTMHWRDDPRKDEVWYAKQVNDLDEITLAQEVDLSYTASVQGVLIPAAWVQAAVNAHVKLGFPITGARRGAFDVADGGPDECAFAARHGVLIEDVQSWKGGRGDEGDIFQSVLHVFGLCDEADIDAFEYDADGLGAGVRGDARVANEKRIEAGVGKITALPFRGSGEVFEPEKPIPTAAVERKRGHDRKERLNKDFFLNAKAQAWWSLRVRFQRTFRAVEAYAETGTQPYEPDDLISLNGDMAELAKLTVELSQPTYKQTTSGKIQVDKTPDGTKSPNHGDAVMIAMAPRRTMGWLGRLAA